MAENGAIAPIRARIYGVPYCQSKSRGDVQGLAKWTEAVRSQTQNLPRAGGPCQFQVTFFLPTNKFPSDHPFGPDIDNLVKRLWDALGATVFSEVEGGDGCVSVLHAIKQRVENCEDAGVEITITPILA